MIFSKPVVDVRHKRSIIETNKVFYGTISSSIPLIPIAEHIRLNLCTFSLAESIVVIFYHQSRYHNHIHGFNESESLNVSLLLVIVLLKFILYLMIAVFVFISI